MSDPKEKFTKHLIIILKEMCKKVGADYDKVDFAEENWYHKFQWTEVEQNEFRDWLADYFYQNREARVELLTRTSKNKKFCRGAASMFVFNYGWKWKKEEK